MEKEKKADEKKEENEREMKEERGSATTEPFPSCLTPKHSVFLLFCAHSLHRN